MAIDDNYYTYFIQEEPQVEVVGMIADLDLSPPYEKYAAAVFKAKRGYLVVFISGCSCWPDRGSTIQIVCPRIVDVDRALRIEWHLLLDKCQAKSWRQSS